MMLMISSLVALVLVGAWLNGRSRVSGATDRLSGDRGTGGRTHEEAVKRANEVRQGIEKDVDGLAAHFGGGVKSGQTEIVNAMLPMAG